MPDLMRIIIIACFFLISFSGSSYAQGTEDKKVREIIERFLERQKFFYKFIGMNVTGENNIKVTPDEKGSFVIQYPDLKITGHEGDTVDLSSLVSRIKPDEQPGKWKIISHLSSPLNFYKQDGTPASRLDIGAQEISALWDETINAPILINENYQDIKISNYEAEQVITIASVKILYGLSENESGLLDGPFAIDFRNIAFKDVNDNFSGTIGSLGMINRSSPFDSASVKQVEDNIYSFAQEVDVARPGFEQNESEKAEYAQIFSDYFEARGDLSDFSFSANDVVFQIEPKEDEQIGRAFAFDALGFGLGFGGFSEDSQTFGVNLSFSGFNMVPMTQNLENAVPSYADIRFRLENFPLTKSWQILEESKDLRSENMNAILARLQDLSNLLFESGTTLRLENSIVENLYFKAAFNGIVKAMADSSYGFVAKTNLKTSGLDQLAKSLALVAQDKGQERNEEMKRLVGILYLLDGMSYEEEEADGDVFKNLTFSLTQDGQLLANGKPLEAGLETQE